jgi:hypothetical protein
MLPYVVAEMILQAVRALAAERVQARIAAPALGGLCW